jgi:hypothetical protein
MFFSEWDAKDEDQSDVNVWEDNWDDDTVEDDFSTQLRFLFFIILFYIDVFSSLNLVEKQAFKI